MTRKTIDSAIIATEVRKVAGDETLLFGFAAIDTLDGQPYVDLQGDQLPTEVLFEAIDDYAKYSRAVLYQHQGGMVGKARHTFPLTADIASELGIDSERTGFLIGVVVDKAMSDLYDEGRINGFSIGGYLVREGETIKTLYIDEVSLVDVPAQEPATIDSEKGDGEPKTYDVAEKRLVLKRSVEETPMSEQEKATLEAAQKQAKDANESLAKAQARIAELEQPAPEVVYKSISGEVFTKDDDERLVKMAKELDDAKVETYAKSVPLIPVELAKAVFRSGDEKAQEQLATLHKGEMAAHGPQGVPAKSEDADAFEAKAVELQKSQGLSINEARSRVLAAQEA